MERAARVYLNPIRPNANPSYIGRIAAGSAIRVSTRLVPDLPGNVPCQVMAPLSVLQSSVHPYLVYAVHRGVESKLVIQGNTDCINLICGPVLSTEQNGPEMSRRERQ